MDFLFGRTMPLAMQSEAGECGLACLTMVAGYHGLELELSQVRERFPVTLKGTTLEDLVQLAGELRLNARPVTVELEGLRYLRLPCVLHWNFNHFVVLSKVTGKCATIYDPAAGIRDVPLAEVSRALTGVALELWPQSDFVPERLTEKVRLRDLVGKVTGLARSVGQIVFLALALEVFSLLSPFFIQLVVDSVIVAADRDFLAVLAIGFCTLTLMQQAVFSIRQWALIYLNTSVSLQWRANVFSHLLRLPLQYFERRFLADVVSRFGSIDNIQRTLATSFLEGVLDGAMTLITLVLMFAYSPVLGGIALGVTVVYAAMRYLMYRPMSAATEKQIVCAARQSGHFLETIRGIKAIKLFQRLDERRAAWLTLVAEQMNASVTLQKMMVGTRLFNGVVYGVGNIAIIWIGALIVVDGKFSVGVLVAFLAYKAQFDGRVSGLIDKLFDLRMLHIDCTRLSDIVMSEPEASGSKLPDLGQRETDIELVGLRYRYSELEPYVLDGISLYIPAGQSIAIVGPSGCGKTTLLNILLGILPPSEGDVTIAGISLRQHGTEAARALIGTVLQDDVLFAGSIGENISFFDSKPDPAWIHECATMAAIAPEIMAMPMRYHTRVGDMGTVLSGGQKQRVLLARALYKRPRILLLDEATSHLDTAKEHEVNAAIRSLNITRVIVAHRQETIACADRVIRLAGARIGADSAAAPCAPPALQEADMHG